MPILGGNGSITVDLKTKQLSGSFKFGNQTVLFDAKITIDNNHIGFEKSASTEKMDMAQRRLKEQWNIPHLNS